MLFQDPTLNQQEVAQYFSARRAMYLLTMDENIELDRLFFDLDEAENRARNQARGKVCSPQTVKNLPIKNDSSYNKTSFDLKTDMSKVDILDNLCSISGRVFSYNFETDPPKEN